MESRQSKKILKRNSKVESYEISWQNLQRDSFTPVPTQSGISWIINMCLKCNLFII